MNSFYESLNIGEQGEKAVKELFARNGFTCRDLTHVKEWQDKDTDFEFSNEHGSIHVEAKADSKPYPNFLIETCSNDTKNTKGWIFKTQADYITLYKAPSQTLYFFYADLLKQYVEERCIDLKHYVKPYICRYGYTYGDGKNLLYKSYNIQISLKELRDANILFYVHDMSNDTGRTLN